MNDNPVYIAGDGFRTIARAFYLSIDNKDAETFRLLNSFLNGRIYEGFEQDNIHSFDQFSALFVYYYEYSLTKLTSSITYKDIYDICAELSVRGLKEKLGWGFRFRFEEESLSVEEKKRINNYSRILLNRYGEIINICLRKKDLGHLTFILNQLHQSSNSYNHKLSDLKWKIHFAKREKQDEQGKKELALMEERYDVDAYLDTTVRLLIKVTLFWSFFLFTMKVLTNEELDKILQTFEGYRGFIESDFVDDLLILRTHVSEHEYSWGRWDYMARPEGVTYSPPDVYQWVTIGAVAYILRNKGSINIDIEGMNPEQVNALEYALGSMQDIVHGISDKGFDSWGKALNAGTEQEFQNRLSSVENRLNGLRNTAITNKERSIAETAIDLEYTKNFKQAMSEGWSKGNALRELFEYFGNIDNIAEDDKSVTFPLVGIRNQIWLGYKTSLIRTADHIPIFGIEKYGEQLANSEENIFISEAFTGDVSEADNILAEIDQSIQAISNAGYTPSIIMCGWNVWSTHFQYLKAEEFKFDWNDNQGYTFSDFSGTYKEIPVIRFRSDLLSNTVIVADFTAAFLLQQRISKDAFKEVLRASISEISQAEATTLIAENPGTWKGDMSEEDAIIRLRNSIKVDFYLIERFLIGNPETYRVIEIRT